MRQRKTVYISIGNAEDRLTQSEWSRFIQAVSTVIGTCTEIRHGDWRSIPDAPVQNACWCIEIEAKWVPWLQRQLAFIARTFQQESIGWTVGDLGYIEAEAA